MKKFERFLISVLWLNAMSIVALCFFDMRFGFNIFANAHWGYLEELQVSGRVAKDFYVAMGAAAAITLIGLYILIVPWHRRIRMQKGGGNVSLDDAARTGTEPRAAMDMTRPPRLSINNAFIPTRREEMEIPKTAPAAAAVPTITPAEVQDILIGAGFQMKKPFRAAGVRMDFVGIGAGEKMIIGTNESAADLSRAVEKINGLFDEVLAGELKIDLASFSTRDFSDAGELAAFAAKNAPRPMTPDDADAFASFSNFTDTAAGYFGNV